MAAAHRIGRLCAVLLTLAGPAPAAALRAPWDAAPPPATATATATATAAVHVCPETPVLPRDIGGNGYYTDAQHSQIDPQARARNAAAQQAIDAVMTSAEAAADRYTETGSADAARCGLAILAAQAEAQALTGHLATTQSFYIRHWATGALAIAYLKLRPSHLATSAQSRAILPWLHTLAVQLRATLTQHRANPKNTDSRNNHAYWTALAVMAAAIATDDADLYAWAQDIHAGAMAQIQPDGTLPLELARGPRALHYHLFAAAPLVTMAELATAQGADLYAPALHRLVNRSLEGLADNRFFAERAGAVQDTPSPAGIAPADLVWVRPYQRRFPSQTTQRLLAATHLRPTLYLGGLPPP